MKKLRQYRIPVDHMTNLNLEVYHQGTLLTKYNSSVHLINISGQGLAFVLDKVIGDQVEIFLTIKKRRFDINSRVVRVVHNYQRRDLLLIGVEFLDITESYSQDLIDTLLDSISSKDLKHLMLDMIQNEGEVAIDVLGKPSEVELNNLNSIMVLDILKTFNRDLRSHNLLELFSKQMCKQLEVKDFRLYLFDNNLNDVYIQDVSSYEDKIKKNERTLFPVNGAVSKVRDRRAPYIVNAGESLNDPFYNLLYALYDIEVLNFILTPVFNNFGVIVGVVEFSNKFKADAIFSDEDIYEASIFSTIVSTILFGKDAEGHNVELKKLFEKFSNNLLIGSSSENQYVNSCILEYAKTMERILITGEAGVGKDLTAKNIHKHSEKSEYGLGQIFCHDIFNVLEIDKLLDTTAEHTGMLELYSGGTIIVSDIDTLDVKLGEYLFKKIHNRSDIRFLATSTKSYEMLCHFSESYRPLILFLCEQELRIPPLRERKDDIFLLANFFVARICEQNSFTLKNFGQDIVKYFHDYDWPGNISELKNAIERLVIIEQQQMTLELKRSRIMPILDRDIDCDFLQGIDLGHDIVKDRGLVDDKELKELFFYLYVQNLLDSNQFEERELPKVFNLDEKEFEELLYHAKMKFEEYFLDQENTKKVA